MKELCKCGCIDKTTTSMTSLCERDDCDARLRKDVNNTQNVSMGNDDNPSMKEGKEWQETAKKGAGLKMMIGHTLLEIKRYS